MKRTGKVLTILLALVMLFSAVVPVFADQSTTTLKTVYKDNSPNTEIYAVTAAPGTDYPYYGAKNEPQGGVYYGRVGEGGETSNGWGLVNKSQLSNESIISFYTNFDDGYSIEYWSYIYGASTADGKHALLINLNFNNGIDDINNVIAGRFDEKLIADLKYLGGRSYPVFLRIGGEMNEWAVDNPSEFIQAYMHIAQLARTYAPKLALVFSPNFSAAKNVDMDSFYPGDEYVDWCGVSLYYNRYAMNDDERWPEFYGVNEYGDAMLNVQQAVNLSRMHSKPLMITEGGSSYYMNGKDSTDFSASRVEKAMANLTMVYPEIKAIVYSDTNFGDEDHKFVLRTNSTVAKAYDAGVAANPTLLHGIKGSYSYYTKLSAYDELWKGEVKLAAYTYYSGLDKLTATWTVDGAKSKTVTTYPYSYSVNTTLLNNGEHTVRVEFSNGASKEYKFYVGKVVKSHPFTDVKKTDYFNNAVQWAYDTAITTGTSATTFGPSESCDRAQVCTFLWRTCGKPEPKTTEIPFKDVADGKWYTKAVLWAVEQGITNGTGDGTTFSPDDPCSNAQIMTFIWRAMGKPDATGAKPYYTDAVNWANNNKMLEGTYTGTYDVEANCPRCNVVEYLYRYSQTK